MLNVLSPQLLSDSYKYSHHMQYPKGTSSIYSYLEAREGAEYEETVFFGLQPLLKDYFSTPVRRTHVSYMDQLITGHMGPGIFNADDWYEIVEKHQGFLPIRIYAVPEGTAMPNSVPLMAVENLDPDMSWVTNFAETLLTHVWYPSTVASTSYAVRKVLDYYAEVTGCPKEAVDYKLHDFGFRGATGLHAAAMGGMAHLLSFRGTDTLPALVAAQQYYNTDEIVGHSIPASEHSTVTIYGEEKEIAAHRNMLEKFPKGLVASVIDSYDTERCIDQIARDLRDTIEGRDGTFVFRPDSGEIVESVLSVVGQLESRFGWMYNGRGFRDLPEQVRVIQGDGCTYETIRAVCESLVAHRYSLSNVAFGMGAGLLQKLDRDTQRFAFKCSHAIVDGVERDVRKYPKTDLTKRSKGGRVVPVLTSDGKIRTALDSNVQSDETDLFEVVWEKGNLRREYTFEEVRENLGVL